MELGTALILIAVLYLLVTNQGFRRVAVGAVIVGVVVTVALFARMAQVRHMRAAEYQASLHSVPVKAVAVEPEVQIVLPPPSPNPNYQDRFNFCHMRDGTDEDCDKFARTIGR